MKKIALAIIAITLFTCCGCKQEQKMVEKAASEIPDFPATLKSELEHCILAHHGKLEYGSPKVPALVEAVALNFADDMDAKLEIFTEISDHTVSKDWLGYNRFFDTNIRLTKGE